VERVGDEAHERTDLLAVGVTDRELRGLRRSGALSTVRPGAYRAVHPDRAEQPSPIDEHRLAVRAAARRLAAGSVISHVSAAVLHGLPLWFAGGQFPAGGRVQVTRDRRSGARRSAYLDLHATALEPDEVTMVDGLLVTSVARTVVDLARVAAFDSAVVTADGALHRGLVTPDELAVALDRGSRRPGNSAARRVIAAADGGSESPGETRSRLAIARGGLPAPVLQHEVRAAGRTWRVDFWWGGPGVVGEFDGRVKYGRLLAPRGDPGEAVFAEKLREDALRAHGLMVVRWTWADLSDFAPVATRLRRALSRS
jgi:predicted transcriptional regulator of viral defense system